jgi:hypothetical protein
MAVGFPPGRGLEVDSGALAGRSRVRRLRHDVRHDASSGIQGIEPGSVCADAASLVDGRGCCGCPSRASRRTQRQPGPSVDDYERRHRRGASSASWDVHSRLGVSRPTLRAGRLVVRAGDDAGMTSPVGPESQDRYRCADRGGPGGQRCRYSWSTPPRCMLRASMEVSGLELMVPRRRCHPAHIRGS